VSGTTDDRAESEERTAVERVCDRLIAGILDGDVDRDNLESAKLDACGEFSSPRVPKNADILRRAPAESRDEVREVVRRKPVRTASGVSPVAIMTSPRACPHGKCLYCPGGPASEFDSAQSYTGQEPAAARGVQTDYDPYAQVRLRLDQLRHIGHPVEKAELILMGGTMTARSHDYQSWFVRRALAAMNDYETGGEIPEASAAAAAAVAAEAPQPRYLEDVKSRNESADVRCVGITFETKPDWCDPEQIDRMLRLGATKVEVGVQTTVDEVNRAMHRGHGTQDSVDASRRLRDAGLKVGYHMMPGQPGLGYEESLADIEEIFANPRWRPDYLKIYPTLVVRGTRTYDMWRRGEFDPLSSAEAAELVAEAYEHLPPWVRLQRVQRDIPAPLIDAGVQKSNLRQLADEAADRMGTAPGDVRAREAGLAEADPDPEKVEAVTRTYEASGGTEQFLSFEDPDADLLVGFCRLRFPSYSHAAPDDPESEGRSKPVRRELADAAVVRELHVYGSEAGLGDEGEWQHRGFGRRLMRRAEERAREAGFSKLAVTAGVGVRPYYREKLGYRQDGPYVSTRL
jgi:elongator complex protein 3